MWSDGRSRCRVGSGEGSVFGRGVCSLVERMVKAKGGCMGTNGVRGLDAGWQNLKMHAMEQGACYRRKLTPERVS